MYMAEKHPTSFVEKNTPQSEWKVKGNSEDFRSKNGIAPGATVISLLPGSRLQEVTRMLSIFSNTVELLKHSFSELTTIIHVAPNQHVKDYISRTTYNWPVSVKLIPGGSPHLKYDALSASRVALCTSGTVAVEMQLARLPCVVAYRAHFLTEWFICWKAKIPFISIPNILLDSAIIPEALLQACTPAKLASLLMYAWTILFSFQFLIGGKRCYSAGVGDISKFLPPISASVGLYVLISMYFQ
ncbi:putative lipid-A-disaccharide synthase, mitochondrial [Vitis vinifera]|uniref:lipid-A-disaccharide synthase n=1 Tax=Vitis vinifera TaxID=29760 RepID=A0A438JHI7_VITVI|nr:putative lipid-A-disaccharide synthase, mitochondrial [Vitis vinifera]